MRKLCVFVVLMVVVVVVLLFGMLPVSEVFRDIRNRKGTLWSWQSCSSVDLK